MIVDCAAVETGCMLEKYVTSPLLLLSFASLAVAAVETVSYTHLTLPTNREV